MNKNEIINFTNDESNELISNLKNLDAMYNAHSDFKKSYLVDEKNTLEFFLKKFKQYINENIGKTTNTSNPYLPKIIPPYFQVNNPSFRARCINMITELDELFLNLPSNKQDSFEESYNDILNTLNALRRHSFYVSKNIPYREIEG